MSLEMKIAGMIAQSKRIDGNLEELVVRLANERATNDPNRPYAADDEEQDAMVALALTTVRQILDDNRLIVTLLQQLMWELAPARLTRT